MADDIGVALIGCGGMGDGLARAVVETRSGRITAVFDPQQEARGTCAAKYSAVAAPSEEALLARADVEAVIIASPPFLHADASVRASAAGKHVFVEKPMALTEADAARMVAAAKAAGKALMVGQVLRYYEPFRTILGLSAQGRLGRPLSADVWRLGTGWAKPPHWRAFKAQCGGFLLEVGSHELDFIRCLLGEVRSVQGVVTKRLPSPHEVEDAVSVQMWFAEGGIGTYLGGAGFHVGDYGFNLRFEKANLRSHSGFDPKALTLAGPKELDVRLEDLEFSTANPVQREIQDWLAAVREGKPVPIPGEDALKNVRIAELAYRTAEAAAQAR